MVSTANLASIKHHLRIVTLLFESRFTAILLPYTEKDMSPTKFTILTGAFFALIGVALGAFGAHALKDSLQALGTANVWETAVDYQIWHALALVAIAAYRPHKRTHLYAAGCFCAGICLFSGSLYWLALDGPRWLGPITPLGGLMLMLGWALLIKAALQKEHE